MTDDTPPVKVDVTHGPPVEGDATAPTPPADVDAQEGQDGQDDAPDDGRSKYRRRAQAAEAERDTARAQLDTARRQIVEAAAGLHLYKPAALWALGTDPADLFDSDGRLDSDKLTEVIKTAASTHGLTNRPKYDYTQGPSGSEPVAKDSTWAEAFSDMRSARR